MRALILTGFSFTSSLGSKIFVGVLLTLLMLTLFPPAHAVSEPPPTEWTRTYGSPDGEWAYSVIHTEDGGYAIGGATAKYSWPERGYVNYSFLLIKTDASGNMQWNKTYGGEDEDDELAYSIIQTGDGGYAIAGIKQFSGVINGEFLIIGDFWLVKTDSEGNMQWNKTYGGAESERLYSVIQTSDGGYALVGNRESLDFPHYADAWFVKTDADGNVQWDRTYGGEDFDLASSVLETDGGYVIGGWTYSFGPGDFWLFKTDSVGNVQWNKTYGGQQQEWAQSVVETEDGGYLLAGRTESFGASEGDAWLVKTDSSGNMQWNKTYGEKEKEYVQSVVQTRDGEYAFAGSVNSEAWVVKTDSTGSMEWSVTFRGYGMVYSIVETGEGGYAFAGETYTDARYDAYLVKIAPPPDTTPTVTFPWWTVPIIIISFLAGVAVTTIIFRKKQRG